jgi:hypothetical protein
MRFIPVHVLPVGFALRKTSDGRQMPVRLSFKLYINQVKAQKTYQITQALNKIAMGLKPIAIVYERLCSFTAKRFANLCSQ